MKVLHFFVFSIISQILSIIQHKGFDVKALRAFRVLRPLRLVSRAPSEFYLFSTDVVLVFLQAILIQCTFSMYRVLLAPKHL